MINHPFWGTPIFGKHPYIYIYLYLHIIHQIETLPPVEPPPVFLAGLAFFFLRPRVRGAQTSELELERVVCFFFWLVSSMVVSGSPKRW